MEAKQFSAQQQLRPHIQRDEHLEAKALGLINSSLSLACPSPSDTIIPKDAAPKIGGHVSKVPGTGDQERLLGKRKLKERQQVIFEWPQFS